MGGDSCTAAQGCYDGITEDGLSVACLVPAVFQEHKNTITRATERQQLEGTCMSELPWICCSCFIQEMMLSLCFINCFRPIITTSPICHSNWLYSRNFVQIEDLCSRHYITTFWPETNSFNEGFPRTCLYIEHLTRLINSQHVGLICEGLWLYHHPIDPNPCSPRLHGP